MKAPYKGNYTVKDFWDKLSAASWYKKYAAANPKEAAALEEYANNKINPPNHPWSTPGDITNTAMGDAILMALMSLQQY